MTTNKSNSNKRPLLHLNKATSRIIKTSGKGIEKTFSWIASDHHGATQQTNLIAILQTINFHLAKLHLMERRIARMNSNFEIHRNTLIKVSQAEKVVGWLIDHFIFLLEIIWGAINPIITTFFQTLLRLVLIVICNCIYFYALYLLFTSDSRH